MGFTSIFDKEVASHGRTRSVDHATVAGDTAAAPRQGQEKARPEFDSGRQPDAIAAAAAGAAAFTAIAATVDIFTA